MQCMHSKIRKKKSLNMDAWVTLHFISKNLCVYQQINPLGFKTLTSMYYGLFCKLDDVK